MTWARDGGNIFLRLKFRQQRECLLCSIVWGMFTNSHFFLYCRRVTRRTAVWEHFFFGGFTLAQRAIAWRMKLHRLHLHPRQVSRVSGRDSNYLISHFFRSLKFANKKKIARSFPHTVSRERRQGECTCQEDEIFLSREKKFDRLIYFNHFIFSLPALTTTREFLRRFVIVQVEMLKGKTIFQH